MVPDNIGEKHIKQALNEIDEKGIPKGRHSSTYDLVYNGNRYPPKVVISIANRFANGEELPAEEFKGGEGTPAFEKLKVLGFNIEPKKIDPDADVQLKIIERYKELIKNDDNNPELYKWRAIKEFQNQWDVDAENFDTMLKGIDFRNLMHYTSKYFIDNVDKYPERARSMFKELFDESRDLKTRIKEFKEEADDIFKEHLPERNAQQNERPISVYLTFRYPDKYTFYKKSYYSEYAALIDVEEEEVLERYPHYLSLIQDLIDDYISKDQELVQLSRNTLLEDCYVDDNLNILAQDILFRVLETGNFTSTGEEDFKNILELTGYKDACHYFTKLSNICDDLALNKDDKRVVLSVRTDDPRLNLIIGQRYCLSYYANQEKKWRFIHPEEEVTSDVQPFGGPPEAYYHMTDDYSVVVDEFESILESSEAELNRSSKSSYLKYKNIYFEEAVFNDKYRNQIFEDVFGRSFKSLDESKSKFTWVETHKKIAEKLLAYRNRQEELIQILKDVGITIFTDIDQDGEEFELNEIDPFTFFRYINKYGDENRLGFLQKIAEKFDISTIPKDVTGIPTSNPQTVWLFPYERDRKNEIEILWNAFESILREESLSSKQWETILNFDGIRIAKFTQSLFLVNPENYLPIDQHTRTYLADVLNIDPEAETLEEYQKILENVRAVTNKSFYELSIDAYNWNTGNVKYWWLDLKSGNWNIDNYEIGQKLSFASKTKDGSERRVYKNFQNIQPGDLIIGFQSSIERVKAILEVVEPLHIDDEENEKFIFEIKQITPNQPSLSELKTIPELTECKVINNGQGSLFDLTEKEYTFIRDLAFKKREDHPSYTLSDALDEMFMDEEEIEDIQSLLEYKKNIILQGPPGTGKTFFAKRLAWLMMGAKDSNRVETIQFHPSYSYEDFIRGYRPTDKHFELQDGIFMKLCKQAKSDPSNPYFLIIDEINRGNLGKIFGELMMLIENDKRGKNHTVRLPYQKSDEPSFYIPENLYLIGTMNTADRSLAMVDYALRRRFVFVDMMPSFGSKFQTYIIENGIEEDLAKIITDKLEDLNEMISEDSGLGPGFQVGHSYFCQTQDGSKNWFNNIIKYEVVPLLNEYWFDKQSKVEKIEKDLLLT